MKKTSGQSKPLNQQQTLVPSQSEVCKAPSMLIDSHAHLDSHRYNDDRPAMLRRAREAGVGAVLSIGIGERPEEMHQARDLCREFNGQPGMPRLYASAGIYPHSPTEPAKAALAN